MNLLFLTFIASSSQESLLPSVVVRETPCCLYLEKLIFQEGNTTVQEFYLRGDLTLLKEVLLCYCSICGVEFCVRIGTFCVLILRTPLLMTLKRPQLLQLLMPSFLPVCLLLALLLNM